MIAIEITELDDTPRSPAAARCADGNGTLTHLFFSDDLVDIARAKAICGRCALRASCLAGALERAEPWGVWGGELLDTGRVVIAKRPRGRPPTRPRPVLVVDEDRRVRELAGPDQVDPTLDVAVCVA
jgi:WhiB family redox-sensing transcriptional regulator